MPPASGERIGFRSRVVLRPTSPQHAAGMRIEPANLLIFKMKKRATGLQYPPRVFEPANLLIFNEEKAGDRTIVPSPGIRAGHLQSNNINIK